MTKVRVEIDQEKCVGAGHCVRTAAAVFDQRDVDGIVVLLNAEPPANLREAVHLAATLCPAAAIRVIDGDE